MGSKSVFPSLCMNVLRHFWLIWCKNSYRSKKYILMLLFDFKKNCHILSSSLLPLLSDTLVSHYTFFENSVMQQSFLKDKIIIIIKILSIVIEICKDWRLFCLFSSYQQEILKLSIRFIGVSRVICVSLVQLGILRWVFKAKDPVVTKVRLNFALLL